MTYRSQCDCICHQSGKSVMHMFPCCEPDPVCTIVAEHFKAEAYKAQAGAIKILCLGETSGNFITGEVQHRHYFKEGTTEKVECPTCGFNYQWPPR